VGQRFLDHGKLIGAASARLILPTVEGGVPWTPFRLSLEAARIALVSTAGIHLTTDPPFDVDAPLGDPSLRVIPSDTRAADLRIAHAHYGHQRAEEDMNVVFPLERLRECVADGALGDLGPRAYSFGFTVQTKELVDPEIGSAHELARRLHADQVDATIFSPA
jgi:D-proline reductase (dithiol) PrdB